MLPLPVRKLVAHNEVLMAMILVWIVGPVILTLAGFLLGTWVTSQHIQDLQGRDIDRGGIGALIGLITSVLIAIGTSAIYPKKVAREYEVREESWTRPSHHH
jgi:hypothetical protein